MRYELIAMANAMSFGFTSVHGDECMAKMGSAPAMIRECAPHCDHLIGYLWIKSGIAK